jgi:uncharacterized membrane protein YedE/YeeE
MASSLLVTIVFFVLGKTGHHYPFAPTLLIEVAFTTFAWLVTAFVTPATDSKKLMRFYSLVHPAGPGWTRVRKDIEQFLAARSTMAPTPHQPSPVLDYRASGDTPAATEHLTDADICLPTVSADHMGMASLGWVSGCVVIWSSLFAIGNFLYARYTYAIELTAVFVVSGLVLLWVINHLWDKAPVTENVAEPLAV